MPGIMPGHPQMMANEEMDGVGGGGGGMIPHGLGEGDLQLPSFRTNGVVIAGGLKIVNSVHYHTHHLDQHLMNEGLNSKAVAVITRVRDKLTGRDFDSQSKPLAVLPQVDRLIKQATSHENLCQCYIGWCPFW